MGRNSCLKTISLPKAYIEKIRVIKKELGVFSDSEVIRRAIDAYANEIIFKNLKGGEQG